MTRTFLRLARGVVVLAALCAVGSPALAEDDENARLLADPDRAPDAERLRRAAEEALEKTPGDERATVALLVAVTWLRDKGLLDDAIERAKPVAEKSADPDVRFRLGSALLRRARMDDPPQKSALDAAAIALGPAFEAGSAPQVLDLAHVRHLLGQVDGARRAYARVVTKAGTTTAEEDLAERAIEGLRNVLASEKGAYEKAVRAIRETPAGMRAWSRVLEATGDLRAALQVLEDPDVQRTARGSLRMVAARARLKRLLGDHAGALTDERAAVAGAGTVVRGDPSVLEAIEKSWRENRLLASFEDCAALERDYDDLVKRAEGVPHFQIAWLNNLAFRLREVVSTYTWRGEGRTQGIAEGAPREVQGLLARCVALYDGAVSLIPKEAAAAPFETRWFYAGVLNDAGLMRHYFVDVRDLARAEALYLRAFELTDGAYMDTYFYNVQYLYGFELPGREETWLRLAQRARTKILAESKDGGFVPDERKRDAAGRDAEALRRKIEDRKGK